jgi:hypothetical protein
MTDSPRTAAPLHGKSCPPLLAGNLAPVNTQYRGHFPFQRLTLLPQARSRLSQIIFRARCWLLTTEVALRVWWRG